MAATNEHHVHPSRRLGRKPKVDKPRLALRNFLTGVVPEAPPVADHFAQVSDWGMYTNDSFGVCGPTSVANSRKLVTRYLAEAEHSPDLADVYDLYRRSGNPNFDPATGADDNGVIVQDMLAEVVKVGIGGTKALGFAEVDHTNIDEMRTAVAIFGFLIIGVDLQVAQQGQTDSGVWTHSKSAEWGGHAILGGRYTNSNVDDKDRFGVVTWAEVVDMTDSFITEQLDEAWVVIWPEHLRDNAFLDGINVPAFADAYVRMTGRPFPGVVPGPTPAPLPATATLSPAVADHVAHVAAHSHLTVSEWLDHHLRHYFKIG